MMMWVTYFQMKVSCPSMVAVNLTEEKESELIYSGFDLPTMEDVDFFPRSAVKQAHGK